MKCCKEKSTGNGGDSSHRASRMAGLLAPADHDKKSAVAAANQRLAGLHQEMTEGSPGSMRFKKLFIGGKTLALSLGNAVHEFEPVFPEPALHLSEGVFRF